MTGHWEASLKEWLVTAVLQEGGLSFEDHPPPGPSGIFLKCGCSLCPVFLAPMGGAWALGLAATPAHPAWFTNNSVLALQFVFRAIFLFFNFNF